MQDCYTPKTDENECLQTLETLLANISEVFVIIDQDLATGALQGRDDASAFWATVFLSIKYSFGVRIALVGTSGPLATSAGMFSEAARKSIIEAEAPRMTQVIAPQSRLARNLPYRGTDATAGREALAALIESLNIGKRFNEPDEHAHGVTQSLKSIDRSNTSIPVTCAHPAGSEKTEVSSLTRNFTKKKTSFDLFDVQTEPMNLGERADQWFTYLDEILYDVISPIPKNRGDRVKVAVLDTGIDITEYYIGLKENRKRISYQSFVIGDLNPTEPKDLHGHGTHVAALLMKVAKNAEIYIVRISETADLSDPLQISKAIYHAVDQWGVDIISMSFGFPSLTEDLECIQSEILHAHSKNVVLFAAARNNGGLKAIAYPASQPEVICINSTDGEGNPSHFNPTAEKYKNFSIVGEDVLSSWPHSFPKRMSGTSFATPVAAGVAAIVMDYMEQKSHVWSAGDGPYISRSIRTRGGIVKIFKRHLSDSRVGFRFICPWKFFNHASESELDKVLLNTLRGS